jgi:serine/threonine protein kinase/Flp pilus assembly protein TadD
MADDSSSKSGATGTQASEVGGFVALRSGLVIRHYVIDEVIGAGGFGITYRAYHERLKAKVFALKEFFPRQFASRSGTHVVSTRDGRDIFRWGLDRFLKEAEALAKCEHPGIVDVVDYFEENGTAYAVLGYVEGQQLGQWLDSLGRPPTQAELDRVFMPLLDALETVHAARLLHRDIAPDNILIRRDGSPCLIDFGACREDIRERTAKLSAIVKHGYSPPEQYHGIAELQGPWTDIYAVGATLYRAISGKPPMDSSRRGALGDDVLPVAAMTEMPYRPGFMAAVDMALRLKPDERPQSIGDWREMLTAAAVPDGPGPGKPSPAKALDRPGSAGTEVAGSRAGGTATFTEHGSGPARHGADDSAASAKSSSDRAAGSRRGLFVATIAALALAGVAAMAYWRSSPPTPLPAPKTEVARPETPAGPQTSGVALTPPPAPAPAPKVEAAPVQPPPVTQQANPDPQPPSTTAGAAEPVSPPSAPIAPPPLDNEQVAATAWAQLAGSRDIAAIERFIAGHGETTSGNAARARLSSLRDEAARTARDAAFQACVAASDSAKAAACTRVIDGDDTAARRSEALHLRGLASRRPGNYDAAIADFTRALELVPDQAAVLNDRGIAHFLKGGAGSNDAAIRDYDAAIRADPRHAEALNNRAWVALQTGRAAAALTDANRSIELMPANGYAYDTRGHIFEALGRRDDAIRDYERAIAIDPSQESSRAALARLRPNRR